MNDEIISFLKMKNCFVSRKNIVLRFVNIFSEKEINLALREMRKQNILSYGQKRWGITWKQKNQVN